MANVTYDDRSFFLGGRRIWLVSGSIHYWRIPAALWRDRLLKAKRAGLNCITTYLAWNVHEPVEGQWNFEGNADVEAFISLAEELGLYVILRPGPYICAEHDMGGLPSWLNAKSSVSLRCNNAAYMHYFDKFFSKILPTLAAHQAVPTARGGVEGSIVLIQNENEFLSTTEPDRTEYLDFITKLFRRSGFTVPMITCNYDNEPPAGGINCANGWGELALKLRRQRLREPAAPLFVTEYYTGWFDAWGKEYQGQLGRKSPRAVARKAMEILGAGGQFNYYMWHGGTNFGFGGSRLVSDRDVWQITSYDYDAPLAEGGGLTEKYYATRPVNLFANHMGNYLADAQDEEPLAHIEDGLDVMNLTGAMSEWAIVTNHGCDEITQATLSLPEAKQTRLLKVNLEPFGAVAVPHALKLPHGKILDYCTLQPLGLFGPAEKPILVVFGKAGVTGEIRIEGNSRDITVPTDGQPAQLEHGGVHVVVLDVKNAQRAWPGDESMVIGPDYMGETEDDLRFAKVNSPYYVLTYADAKIDARRSKAPTPKPSTPRLGSWKRLAIHPEPMPDADTKLEWQKIDRPRDVDHLGIHQGYAWYRIEIHRDRPAKPKLYLPEIADRATLFLNGKNIGVFGDGPGAIREPIPVQLARGKNVLVALVDNLGRFAFGDRLDWKKGLFGHVWNAREMRTGSFRIHPKPAGDFPKRIIPRHQHCMMPFLETQPLYAAEITLSLTKLHSVHMTFDKIPHNVAVFCNDRPAGFFKQYGDNFGEVLFSSELKKGKNTIRLLLWGDVETKESTLLESVRFFALEEPLSAGESWHVRPLTQPPSSAREPVAGKPCWYQVNFKCPAAALDPDAPPMFVKLFGAKKGQLFLNGQNIGRYWSAGPQDWYYLPSAWLAEENQLQLFEEQGNTPTRCQLAYKPKGPFAK
jgi:beta-galactosidase